MADLEKINIRVPFSPPNDQTRLNKATIRVPFSPPSDETRLNKLTIRLIFKPRTLASGPLNFWNFVP